MKELMLFLFIVFPLRAAVGAINGLDCHKSSFFQKVEEGKALADHVISTYYLHSELDCLFKCLLNEQCRSLNIENKSQASHLTCELNNVTQGSRGHALVKRPGFSYYEPIILSDQSGKLFQTSCVDDAQNFKKINSQLDRVTPATSVTIQTSATAIYLTSMTSSVTSTFSQTTVVTPFTMTSSSIQVPKICQAGWHSFRGGCIMFSTNSDQRGKVRETCKSFGADLVKITSAEENNRIVDLAPAKGQYYIGLCDLVHEGVFRWASDDSVPTYTNWKNGHPNTPSKSHMDCVVLSTNSDITSDYKKWLTVQCQESWRYVCQL